ncbi:MAG: type II toxin-antitoxin system prevent-host-death family antitoxin [Terriglobales bacterium]
MYTVHQAKTNLSRLIREAENGKEVVIARGRKPVAKLVAIAPARKRRVPGKLRGSLWMKPTGFDPMTPAELKEWGIE